MKFIGIILLLLTSIFLIACSANQASNKISNSELENLASKYGGVYIFDKKFLCMYQILAMAFRII